MTLKGFIKNNKLFFTITVFFLLWIGFLVTLSVIISREVVFYDYLADKDVSSEYSSQIPILRYIIEPIVGFTLYLTFRNYYFPLTILLGYIVIRTIYLIFKKKQKIPEKINLFIEMVRNFFEFISKLVAILLIAIIAYFGIGFLLVGELVKYGFVSILEIIFSIGLVLMIYKIISILYTYFYPHLNFRFTQKRMEKRERHKILRSTKREFTYFLGIIFLIITPMLLLMSCQLPTQSVATDLEDDEILIDFHAHTTISDGWQTPEERVRWYIEQGIDVAVITDHEHTEGAKQAKEYVKRFNLDLTILLGQEYTTNYGIHLNIYGLDYNIVPIEFEHYEEVSDDFTSMKTEDMIKYVKNEGGYVIVNHYSSGEFDEDSVPYTLEELRDWGVDGFEIINSGGRQSEEIRLFCLENDIICISATDVHEIQELSAFMKLKMDNPKDLSIDNIFKNLRRNDHEAILIEYSQDIVQFEGFFGNYGEIEHFINYLFNLDTYQYLSWIIWSLGAYSFIGLFYKNYKSSKISELKVKLG
ncbi:MAG: PHP domain-containing protein [Promethearchaeota archaeon]